MFQLSYTNVTQVSLYIVLGALIYWAYQKKNYSLCLGFILSLGFCLRLFPSLDIFLNEWDERYHALVAKHLLLHPLKPTLYEDPIIPYNYELWGRNHVWLHKQPLTLWLMAFSIKLFGLKAWAVRIPSVIFSTLTLYLSFEIARKLFNKEIAIWATLFLAINGLVIEVACGRTTADHVDTLYFFWITLALYFCIWFYQEEKQVFIFLIGLSLGLAVLTKWVVALFVLALFVILVKEKQNWIKTALNLCLILLCIFLIVFPWQYYIFTHFPQEAKFEFAYNQRHFWEHLEGHTGRWWFYLEWAGIGWNELIYLAALWFAYTFFKNPKQLNHQVLATWIAIPYIFFTLARTRGQAYTLFTAPAIFMVQSLFCFELLALNEKKWQRVLGKTFVFVVFVLAIRYTHERVKPLEIFPEKEQVIHEIQVLQQKIGNQKAVVFNVTDPYQTMFFSPYIAYYAPPYPEFIPLCKQKGYAIYVLDTGNLPPDMYKNPDIQVLKL